MKEVLLGDICKITSSKRIFESEYVRNGVAFIRGQEISDKTIGREDVSYECYISKERYEELKESNGVPQIGDILITAVGTIGNLCYVDFDMPFYFKDGNVIWFTDFSDTVDSQYLYYFMQSPYFKKQLENALIGAVQKALTMVMLKDIHFELPPMDIQKAIVEIMSNIDDKINLNNSICSDLESMAKLLYDYWFVQFDFPDENERPYKSSGGKMVWNDELKREIPEGWEVVELRKHINVRRGISYSSDDLLGEGIPMINLNSFYMDASYKISGIKTYSGTYSKEKTVKPYDLIICATQQTSIDITGTTNIIAKAMLVPDIFETDVVCSMDVIMLDVDDCFGKCYLRDMINLPFVHKYISGFASGTKIKHLDINGLLNMKHEVPKYTLIKKYNNFIMKLEFQKSNIIKENQELVSLRDFLLPMLMNGQIKIEDMKAS